MWSVESILTKQMTFLFQTEKTMKKEENMNQEQSFVDNLVYDALVVKIKDMIFFFKIKLLLPTVNDDFCCN